MERKGSRRSRVLLSGDSRPTNLIVTAAFSPDGIINDGLGGILLQFLTRPQLVRTVSRARQRLLPCGT